MQVILSVVTCGMLSGCRCYEKIYLFLWLWTFALDIVTLLSITRLVWLLVPWRRRPYVHGLLRDGRLNWYAAGRDERPDTMKVLDNVYKYLGVCTLYMYLILLTSIE